jgi:hypothetical protein
MNPSRPYRLSAVPWTLHAQLEIATAIRTLLGPDDDELLRQRRAEILAIRRDLDVLVRDVRKLGEDLPALVMADLQSELKKYSPDQPRVPAGNPDGGQWTSGSEGVAGSGETSHLSDNNTSEVSGARVQYAQAETNTRTDETSRNAANTAAHDTSIQGNLPGVLYTLLTVHDPRRQNIWSYTLPEDHPRAPVEFVDSDGVPIHDNQGQPIFRPASMPPERYVQAGLANPFSGTALSALMSPQDQVGPWDVTPSVARGIFYSLLLPVSPGGSLDAERFDFSRVIDYRHYLNIMIGVYGAAAGLDQDDVLSTIDDCAVNFSRFGRNDRLDDVYTHSAKQDVEDTKLGYRLYQSGRIRLGR